MENNIIKNRKKKPNKILIILLIAMPVIFVYLLRDDIISILNDQNQVNLKKAEISDVEIENNKSDKENTALDDFVLDKFAKSNDLVRKSNLQDIKFALQLYANMHDGKYPVSLEEEKLSIQDAEVRKKLLDFTTQENLQDPKHPSFYYTYQSSDGVSFELIARLENIKDLQCKMINDICLYKVTN